MIFPTTFKSKPCFVISSCHFDRLNIVKEDLASEQFPYVLMSQSIHGLLSFDREIV